MDISTVKYKMFQQAAKQAHAFNTVLSSLKTLNELPAHAWARRELKHTNAKYKAMQQSCRLKHTFFFLTSLKVCF